MNDSFAYVGRCGECGGIMAAVNIRLTPPKALAKYVADYVRRGLIVEQVTNEQCETEPWGHAKTCLHYKPPKEQQGS